MGLYVCIKCFGDIYHNYPDHDLYLFPPGVKSNKFPLSGDPTKGTGFVDGLGTDYSWPPGERRFTCSSGHFTMALGDTQEVIIAMIGGIGSDRLSSISVMKHYARLIRSWKTYIFEMGFKEEESPPAEPIPNSFRLLQNYPNPFITNTEIHFDLPVGKRVKISIYNLLGQEIKILVNQYQKAGSYAIQWDGTNANGEPVPHGIYLCTIKAGNFVKCMKMTVLGSK